MDFSRLAAALDGNAALQRRARLAALSFAVAGRHGAGHGARRRAHRRREGRGRERRLRPDGLAGKLGRVRQAGAGRRLPEPRRHAARRPSAGRGRHPGLGPPHAVPGAGLRRAAAACAVAASGRRRRTGHRARGRPLPAARLQRPAASPLLRGSRAGHSLALPAHRRRRRPAVSRTAERSGRSPRAFASSPSTCRGMASPRRRPASRPRLTSSPPSSTSIP